MKIVYSEDEIIKIIEEYLRVHYNMKIDLDDSYLETNGVSITAEIECSGKAEIVEGKIHREPPSPPPINKIKEGVDSQKKPVNPPK